jgi:hypothetical protein
LVTQDPVVDGIIAHLARVAADGVPDELRAAAGFDDPSLGRPGALSCNLCVCGG